VRPAAPQSHVPRDAPADARRGARRRAECIDTWLERRLRSVPRLACPVCSGVVGGDDDAALEEDTDPTVARDLAWLTELRRNHPGFFW